MIEAVPNVSEGRNVETIDAISEAIRLVEGVHLLNVAADLDHNRTVFTYVSEDPEQLLRASLDLYRIAIDRIDLRRHRGAHPRVGAVDVMPYVPLRGGSMEECVALARRAGEEVARIHDLPVYLYEFAATAEHRRELPAIRAGQFEQFHDKIADPMWTPDYGPPAVHSTAGVTIIGARVPLVAFNVQLQTNRIDIAEKIARAVRGVSGGLRFVRALPISLEHRGIVQVSMNLLDYRKTPLHRAFALVREEAARWGVSVLSSEIIGLVPEEALFDVAAWNLQIEKFSPDLVLERRIVNVTGKRA